jgi:mannose-6-phosphate isomerase-like protein (cupin superfamily)
LITKHISKQPDVIAPDGSEVRVLAATAQGSMAQFSLPAGKVSAAVAHHTVEELWVFIEGQGKIWRRLDRFEVVVDVRAGVSISIPIGTHFQFRNDGAVPLVAISTTMPPWPGPEEAYFVDGPWQN